MRVLCIIQAQIQHQQIHSASCNKLGIKEKKDEQTDDNNNKIESKIENRKNIFGKFAVEIFHQCILICLRAYSWFYFFIP